MPRMMLYKAGVLSVAKTAGAIYGGIGLVIGALLSIAAIAGATFGPAAADQTPAFISVVFGVGAVLLLPIIYGLMGFLAGLIGAAIFNLAGRFTGGIEVEFVTVQETTRPPQGQ